MTDAESTAEASEVVDPGLVRAGAAAAARRRELDISQRSLAADGIINAGALIAFEKGRSWPRERTRAKLEEVLQWPAGTIARLRQGEPAARQTPAAPAPVGGEGQLIAQAIITAVHTLGGAIEALPPVDDAEFTPRVAAILADLRQLEGVAASATRISRVTPSLIKALGTVRRQIDELTMLAATAPRATLGQRVYATRRRANLTIAETAQAAGVSEDDIARAEADEAVPVASIDAIEALLKQLD
jgi:transcriptional regulator with XRE-family HTH domain